MALRSVKVTYSNGEVINTNMASHLTNEEIKKYYAIGKKFNVGIGGKDKMATVKKVEILDEDESKKSGSLNTTFNYTIGGL